MIRFFISLLGKKRKISAPFWFFEVDKEVYFDWNRFNFNVKKIISAQLAPEKKEIVRKLNQKVRALDDHPLLYSLYKVKKEISEYKEKNADDELFIKEMEKIESKFTFGFEKKIYEMRLRSILEHLEFVPFTNIISKKDIYEEVLYIESIFHGIYEIERLTKKVKVLLDESRFEKQSLFV